MRFPSPGRCAMILAALATFHIVLPLLPLTLYVAAAVLQAREVRVAPEARLTPLPALIALVAVVTHAWILFGAIETDQRLALAITDSASLVGWVVGCTTLVAMVTMRTAALPAVLLLFAGVLETGTGLLTGFREVHAPQWEITAHIGLAALAAGWLSIAAVVVLLISSLDSRLHARAPLGLLALLPPIETLERVLFRAVGGGFVVLSFALLTGLFYVYDLFSQHLLHKTTLAIIAWLVFGVLLWGRYRYGWRGRKALRFTIAGFVILALAYFGSKFVLENLLGRHWG